MERILLLFALSLGLLAPVLARATADPEAEAPQPITESEVPCNPEVAQPPHHGLFEHLGELDPLAYAQALCFLKRETSPSKEAMVPDVPTGQIAVED
jgi:hypothetical protein